ncbi:MAG: hypothetical protein LC737_01630 [Chloroflexi bacterium]|nr:hypothetical protein [Chloroflexota bacterium]
MRVLFMGTLGTLSAIPPERMLNAGIDVLAVVVPAATATAVPIRVIDPPPAPSAEFNLQRATQRNIVQLARDHAIPALEVSEVRHPQTLSLLRALAPELIVVSCFPFILPVTLLRIAEHGGWNLHPSLLPKLRGPDPLFWTFHEGCCAGVTLHRMSARVDAGEIIAWQSLDFLDGTTYADAEHACAQWGARLLLDALRDLERGTLHASPQDERAASYFPFPSAHDLVITSDWSARRAYNFIRAVSARAQPSVQIGAQSFTIRDALGYDEGAHTADVLRVAGDECWVQFADGVLHV